MAIEIRELIIRATVTENKQVTEEARLQKLKEKIIKACTEEVLEKINMIRSER